MTLERFHGRTVEQCIDDCSALSEQIDLSLASIATDDDGNLLRADLERARDELLAWLRARVGDDAFLSFKTVLEAALEHGDTRPKALRNNLALVAQAEAASPKLARRAFTTEKPEA